MEINKENIQIPPYTETENIKIGRFEARVTRKYLGIREKEVEALRFIQSIPDRSTKE